MTEKSKLTRRLIEEWLPIADLGIESLRERTPMTPFPAPNRLHVWWARRPLVASRAAVLASLLPADADRARFKHVLGIHGDPVASKRRINAARRNGVRFEGEAYSYPRAFTYGLSKEEREWSNHELRRSGIGRAVILDPTAGGGSIPFEAARSGLATIANDLNPVAALILKLTIQVPLTEGAQALAEFERLSTAFLEKRETALAPFFPPEPEPNSVPTNFIWARTVTCPHCDGLVPLSPNWRLNSDGVGVKLHPEKSQKRVRFEIVHNVKEHSEGTVKGGDGLCPFCARVIDGDEIKAQAQAGKMGEQLYCVVYKRRIPGKGKREKWERGYRAPRDSDDVSKLVADRLAEKMPEWESIDAVPTEAIDTLSNYDRGHRLYGMSTWRDLFSPRQLFGHASAVEVYCEMLEEERAKGALPESTRAAFAYLGLSLDKLRDYNSRFTRWHSTREVVVNTFDRHDFSLKWSYAEMAPLIAGLGFDWAIDQTAKCIGELIDLARPDLKGQSDKRVHRDLLSAQVKPPPVTITCKSGDSLDHIDSASVDAAVMDPPYYDNVMYAELSDFFYVWLKRTAGRVYPELFTRRLTDKESEAVANPAKFRGETGAKARANRDYQQRMAAIFTECRRVLKADGILTLMFTHKATGAWDALTKGLMEAGFVITASWPINTEAEGSLHIKDKSAANSTIFLVCRPRPDRVATDEVVYWEDVEPLVRKAVRARIEEFRKAGIRGVDLYLSCFGPALEEFSRHWPLKRGTPRPEDTRRRARRVQAEMLEEPQDPYAATPEDALDAARREVKQWRLSQFRRTSKSVELDKLTEWFVLAWDAFAAPEFPYDEALRLARVVGLDLDQDVIGVIAEKKGSDVILWDSAVRIAKDTAGSIDGSKSWLDTIHRVAHLARERSVDVAREALKTAGVENEPEFKAALEAVLEVLPVSRQFGGDPGSDVVISASSDFEALENLRRLAYSQEIKKPQQLALIENEVA